jgi:hypothetical protein
MTVLSRIPDEWVARRAFVSAKKVNLKVDFATSPVEIPTMNAASAFGN